ncbi:hypothetical protein IUY40_05985 [Flavobacterium sp. ALJ2]|uniref:hypothetical protein n=1 Tax=Flavobacterium sp. ALJ2 TaxID=2786960 RepID=UPI00189D7ACF|nr:hypothetical protein [Flavobacterium sp. ALJ2]MBF7091084.1 hypothetical protein [Flavobacterium sp. ALJ2]
MTKVLKFRDVKSDVDNRMKDFEKIRIKLNVARAKSTQSDNIKSSEGKKETKGLFDSISSFFYEGSKPVRYNGRK